MMHLHLPVQAATMIADRVHIPRPTVLSYRSLCASQALLWLGSLALSGAVPAAPGENFDPVHFDPDRRSAEWNSRSDSESQVAVGGRQLQAGSNILSVKILVGEATDPESFIAYDANGAWHRRHRSCAPADSVPYSIRACAAINAATTLTSASTPLRAVRANLDRPSARRRHQPGHLPW
jgi:hypothetical protein